MDWALFPKMDPITLRLEPTRQRETVDIHPVMRAESAIDIDSPARMLPMTDKSLPKVAGPEEDTLPPACISDFTDVVPRFERPAHDTSVAYKLPYIKLIDDLVTIPSITLTADPQKVFSETLKESFTDIVPPTHNEFSIRVSDPT
jgi:hypothetical protein